MKRIMLEPLVSVGGIIIGDSIKNYPNRQFEYRAKTGDTLYQTYSFKDIPVDAFVKGGKIESLRCDKECIWQGKNLIGMSYSAFKHLYPKKPDAIDYGLSVGEELQDVYDYDDIGLQLWVYKKIIVTIIATVYED